MEGPEVACGSARRSKWRALCWLASPNTSELWYSFSALVPAQTVVGSRSVRVIGIRATRAVVRGTHRTGDVRVLDRLVDDAADALGGGRDAAVSRISCRRRAEHCRYDAAVRPADLLLDS